MENYTNRYDICTYIVCPVRDWLTQKSYILRRERTYLPSVNYFFIYLQAVTLFALKLLLALRDVG
jgi:hypothetical protein